MKKYICISLGGAVGALLRFAIKNVNIWNYNGVFPVDTLVINITGCFVLAVFLTVVFEKITVSEDIRLGIATGLIGAYTTFSTLCRETVVLITNAGYFYGFSYVMSSILLGLGAVFFGVFMARNMVDKAENKRTKKVGALMVEGGEAE